MNEEAHYSSPYPERMGDFTIIVRSAKNGFIVDFNGFCYVVQGTGDPRADFEELLATLEMAHGRFNDGRPK